MVVLSTLQAGRIAKLESAAVESNTLQVVSAEIHEGISQCYRCELELVSTSPDLDSEAILQNTAYLGIKQGVTIKGSDKRGVQTLKYHGVFSSFEQCEKHEDLVRYRAVLVPRLWKLSLNVQSRIFMDKTVVEIVEEVLKEHDLDYELRTGSRSYPTREFVAQYQEPDLHFIQRIMEGDGLSYFFLQGDEGEIVICADSNDAFEPILGDAVLPYRSGGGEGAGNQPQDWFLPEIVYSFTCRHNLVPAEVVLQDYNYRTPSTDLKSSASVGSSGEGTVYEYGAHYKDTSEGGDLAKIRAEEIKCREKVFLVTTDCKSMRAGATVEITEHYRSDYNAKYLIIESQHKVEQSVTLKATAGSVASFESRATLIGSDQTYRPERRTPRPRISGTMNAKVDAAADGQYAEIDDTGRYKITIPFDLSGKSGGQASRYMRKAEPYAGAGMGMHFPLHKNTEVVLAFTNGDPDRPIVVGSIPNAESVGPVTGSNQTQCKVHSGGGNEMILEDTDGAQYTWIYSPAHESHFSIGTQHHSIPCPDGAVIGTKQGVSINAGEGVSIAAGSANHDEGINNGSAHVGSVAAWAAGISAVLATGISVGVDALTEGIAAIPAILADVGGCIGGFAGHQSVYISGPNKVAVIGGAETVIGAGASLDLVAAGSACLLSSLGTLVGGINTASLVAGRDTEMVAIAGDAKIEALFAGDVKIYAKKNITATAATENIQVTAEENDITVSAKKKNVTVHAYENMTLFTGTGWGKFFTKKEMSLESTDTKELQLKAGNSTITLKDDEILIQANRITLLSKDEENSVQVNDEGNGSYAVGISTAGKQSFVTDDSFDFKASKECNLKASQKFIVDTAKMDTTKAKQEVGTDHEDG